MPTLRLWDHSPPLAPERIRVADMDTVKERVKELLKLSKYGLSEKAAELKLKNIDGIGKIKLAVMIAVKENLGE